jgi:hypothetical protein
MVEAKSQLLWLETTNNNNKILGRNRGIPKTQLGSSLDQKKLSVSWQGGLAENMK